MVGVCLLVDLYGRVVGTGRQTNLLGQVGCVTPLLVLQVILLATEVALVLHRWHVARREGKLGERGGREERKKKGTYLSQYPCMQHQLCIYRCIYELEGVVQMYNAHLWTLCTWTYYLCGVYTAPHT